MLAPDIVKALVSAIELKDLSTAAHTWRVTLYTRAMAEHAKLSHDTIERLSTAASLHDVGKIDIEDAILQKPGPLTPAEFDAMKRHTTLGHLRLKRMGVEDPDILNLVRHHHERWDGLGYPDHQRGEEIPLGARYFAVIDSFDALTSLRPYRRDIGPEAATRAIAELEAGAGTRYWPHAVEAFATLYRTGSLDWILNHFNDTCPITFDGTGNPQAHFKAPPPSE